jgi:hypothetical protein
MIRKEGYGKARNTVLPVEGESNGHYLITTYTAYTLFHVLENGKELQGIGQVSIGAECMDGSRLELQAEIVLISLYN